MFILDILDFILELIGGIVDFFKEIFDAIQDENKAEKIAKEAQKYHEFTGLEDLPSDWKTLYKIREDCEKKGDRRRVFLCTQKLAETSFYDKAQLAMHCWNGDGTERDPERAREQQIAYFDNVLRDSSRMYRYLEWMTGDEHFYDPVGLEQVARRMIADGCPEGMYYLEDAVTAQALGLEAGASIETRKAAYGKVSTHPLAMFHLWLCGGQKDEALRARAAGQGCYLAAKSRLDRAGIKQWLDQVQEKLALGADTLAENAKSDIAGYIQAYQWFEQGVAEYEAGEDSLENPAWALIDRAVDFGCESAMLWSCRRKAVLGDAEGELQLAMACLNGTLGLERDVAGAVALLRRAVEKEHPVAQYQLARILESGLEGILADPEQAWLLYNKAAEQGLPDAALRVGELYTYRDRLDTNKAQSYLVPLANDAGNTAGDINRRRRALLALMQLYRGREVHDSLYGQLEQAYDCAFEIAQIDLADSDSEDIRNILAHRERTKRTAKDVEYLKRRYYRRFNDTESDDEEAIYETIVLWFIKLQEAAARQGDVNAMLDLFDEYGCVGSYQVSPGNGTIKLIRFRGNRAKRVYWIDKAIALGNTVAMWSKGENWQKLDISEAEGNYLIQKAARLGDDTAALMLEVQHRQRMQAAEFEREARAYLRRVQQAEQAAAAEWELEQTNLEAVNSVHEMPAVITGPYNRTYYRSDIHPFSAEYTSDQGDHVVIQDRDIGAAGTSARNASGYFYW